MTTPYTYLLGWPSHNMWYYGVRYSEGCHPDDLWTVYKTSSKHVKQFAAMYGDPDVIQVRRIFSDEQSARNWEHRCLRRMKVVQRSDFLNKTDGKAFEPMPGELNPMYGNTHTEEARLKISASKKGKPGPSKGLTNDKRIELGMKPIRGKPKGAKHSEQARKKRSESMRGMPQPSYLGRAKGSDGFPHSDQTKKKLSEAAQRREKFYCPDCDKTITGKMNWARHLQSSRHRAHVC